MAGIVGRNSNSVGRNFSSGALIRFFRTPKGLLTIVLGVVIALGAWHEGVRLVLPGLASAVVICGILDAAILRFTKGRWEFPSGAVLTAAIVAMVLSVHEPWYVTTVTSAIGVAAKYGLRTKSANIFNPAALGIVATFYVFHTSQSWWGALPDLHWAAQLVMVAGGVFIAQRVNKLPLVVAFLGGYYLLFTIAAFAADPGWVAEIFRPPDLEAALFFAFFILTDPPTSPVRFPDQIVCGLVVSGVSFAFFEWLGVVYYLLAGVLAGNVWEASRRATSKTRGQVLPRATSDPA